MVNLFNPQQLSPDTRSDIHACALVGSMARGLRGPPVPSPASLPLLMKGLAWVSRSMLGGRLRGFSASGEQQAESSRHLAAAPTGS